MSRMDDQIVSLKRLRAVSVLVALPLLPSVAQGGITAEVIGDRVRASVDAGSGASAVLKLVWDACDRGEKFAAWANSAELAAMIPSEGGTFELSRSQYGIGKDATLRVLAVTKESYEIRNLVTLTGDGAYLDTGIADSDCTGVEFGASVQEGGSWNTIIFGSKNSCWNKSSNKGVSVCKSGQSWKNWYVVVEGKEVGSSATGNGWAAKNELSIRDGLVAMNGTQFGTEITSSALGTSGSNLYLGRASDEDSVILQDWYYLKLYGSEDRLVRDYVPAKRLSDAAVGFFDKVNETFSPSSGDQDFVAGSTKAGELSVYSTAMCSESFTVPMTTLAVAGDLLTVTVPTGAADSGRVYVAWDAADCGENPADWANKHEIAGVVTAAGGVYTAKISALNIPEDATVRAFVVEGVYRELSLVSTKDGAYVDTGIRDSNCTGIEFGAAVKEGGSWHTSILGSVNSRWNSSKKGFTICKNNQSWMSWSVVVDGTCLGDTPNGNGWATRNDFSFRNGTVMFNGEAVWKDFSASTVGTSGKTICIGRASDDEMVVDQDWFYVRFYGACDVLLAEFCPAKNMDDNAVGLLDLVSGTFLQSSAGKSLVEGKELDGVHYVVKDASEAIPINVGAVVAATWTGSADGRLDDPANWICRNGLGDVVPDAIPGNKAIVRMEGDLPSAFDGSGVYRGVVFGEAVLAGDCDLTRLSGIAIEGTVDVAGHLLSVVGLTGNGTVTSSAADGALRLSVADGKMVSLSTVSLAGALKFIKDGAGELVLAKDGQTFDGGLEIVSGKVRGNTPKASIGMRFGKTGGTITVCERGVLDVYADEGGFVAYEIVLAGGTLMNSSEMASTATRNFGKIRLTADSQIVYDQSLSLCGSENNLVDVDLGGHRLTVNGGQSWGMLDVKYTTIRNGELFIASCRLRVGITNGDWLQAAEATIRIGAGARINLLGGIKGGTVICESSANDWNSDWGQLIEVAERFAPTTDRFNGLVKLMDGATLDCSTRRDAVATALKFADFATIQIAASGRKDGDLLVGWDEATKPINLETLKFKLIGAEARLGMRVQVREEGLILLGPAFVISIR